MKGAAIQARNVFCVLHDTPTKIQELCDNYPSYEYDFTYSGQGSDERMSDAFDFCEDSVRPSLTNHDRIAISEHQNAAYILSPRLSVATAIDEARRALGFVDQCFERGARAVKCESSGLTHGRERWKQLAERSDDVDLYFAWVRRPLDDDGVIYSCGFHLLGHPDIEVVGEPVSIALDLIDLFAMYLLVDKPGERLQPGTTFSISPGGPIYKITFTQCRRYEEDDFFFNPNGYWCLERA